jgi:hypothetical protein
LPRKTGLGTVIFREMNHERRIKEISKKGIFEETFVG